MTDEPWSRRPFSSETAAYFFGRSKVQRPARLLTEVTRDGLRFQELILHVEGGAEAPATVISNGSAAGPGAVICHGGFDDGRRFFLAEAMDLARLGVTVVLPVTRVPRPRPGPVGAAAVIRTGVLTQLAALDHLDQRLDRGGPLCFLGHSGGGMLGAYLSGVDARLQRIVIFGYGVGTFGRLARADGVQLARPLTDDDEQMIDWLDVSHFVGQPNPRSLLVQHGLFDDAVPIAEGRALFAAAAAPKQWAEYDCGHDVSTPAAQADRRSFITSAS